MDTNNIKHLNSKDKKELNPENIVKDFGIDWRILNDLLKKVSLK